jgi:DUF1365 family protein
MEALKSRIFTGTLHHRRTAPKVHDFRYQVLYFYLDLDEVEQIFPLRGILGWIFRFQRSDYFLGQSKRSLKESVLDLVEAETGIRPEGPVRMLTQIRTYGFCFNPVTFYYCFDASSGKLQALASEITNTPWNERRAHAFLNTTQGTEWGSATLKKDFHVSPFFEMDYEYRWKWNSPGEIADGPIKIRMENWRREQLEFEANLSLRSEPLHSRAFSRLIYRFPLLTLKAFLAIYLQAAKIYLKKIPFVPHPKGVRT